MDRHLTVQLQSHGARRSEMKSWHCLCVKMHGLLSLSFFFFSIFFFLFRCCRLRIGSGLLRILNITASTWQRVKVSFLSSLSSFAEIQRLCTWPTLLKLSRDPCIYQPWVATEGVAVAISLWVEIKCIFLYLFLQGFFCRERKGALCFPFTPVLMDAFVNAGSWSQTLRWKVEFVWW